MNNSKLLTYPIASFFCFCLIASCSKKETFDTRPIYDIKAKLVFNPEITGMPGTNTTDSSCLGYGSFIVKDAGSDSSILVTYFSIDGSYYIPANPPLPERQANFTYPVAVSSPKFKKGNLKTGEMNWLSTTDKTAAGNVPTTFCTVGYYQSEDYKNKTAWQTVKASSNINFYSYPDSYIKFNFTSIYTKHLESGTFTYADGSFDITLLGAVRHPFFTLAFYYGQAHLTGNFSGMQLEGY